MEDSTKMTITLAGLILLMMVVIAVIKLGLPKLFEDSYQTESGIELTVVDKDHHTSYIHTGKAMIPQSSYSITVDLGDGTTYEFKCTLSQYQSVEIGSTTLFSVVKTKDNKLVEVRLE